MSSGSAACAGLYISIACAGEQPVEARYADMSPTAQPVQSNGIYHGLPTFQDDARLRGLTAVVTGANGISGYHMVKVLAAAPERWSKIYCLSRKPPPDYFFSRLDGSADRVKHVEADFLSDPEMLAKELQSNIERV